MPTPQVILLSNFYGTYLDKERFTSSAIVNNAGIEQLASLGVSKVKEVKAAVPSSDPIYVVILAGLTDVLIKSIDDGKNKLEITPNSTQLIETKMMWAQKLLIAEGVKIVWAVMPPISLRMYHKSEGWNVAKIPGMSSGLDKEQRMLNERMLDYRGLCLRLNSKDHKKVMPGLYFTDMVTELSNNKSALNLNTSYFESDGISPTPALINNWKMQADKLFASIEQAARNLTSDFSARDDQWALPAPKRLSLDHKPSTFRPDQNRRRSSSPDRLPNPTKRSYDHFDSLSGPLPLGSERFDGSREYNRGRHQGFSQDRTISDGQHVHRQKRPRDFSPPPSNIPSLLDFQPGRPTPNHNFANTNSSDQAPEQLAAAMQLIASSMNLNSSTNVQSMVNAFISRQKGVTDREMEMHYEKEHAQRLLEKEQHRSRMLEEERRREAQKRLEEEKRQEIIRREKFLREEEQRRREEIQRDILQKEQIQRELIQKEQIRREIIKKEEQRKRQQEEARLREVQLAAKLAMEHQKIEERRRQAQLALMAVTNKVRKQMNVNALKAAAVKTASVSASSSSNSGNHFPKSGNALDRINEKLKNDKLKNDSPKADFRVVNDKAWKSPVVLFSFANRMKERKPLRGIIGPKLTKNSKELSDYKSRGQRIYAQSLNDVETVSYLKVTVKRPGFLTDFESKVADFNNRVFDMLSESETLIMEGRAQNYIVRRQLESTGGSRSHSSEQIKDASVDPSSTVTENSSKDTNATKSVRSRLGDQTVEDLRNSLRNKDQDISQSPQAVHNGNAAAVPSATECKPRWDKSDESEDELLWDDEEVTSTKPTLDEDDVKSEIHDLTTEDEVKPPPVELEKEKVVEEATVGGDSAISVKDEPDESAEQNVDEFVTIDEAA